MLRPTAAITAAGETKILYFSVLFNVLAASHTFCYVFQTNERYCMRMT